MANADPGAMESLPRLGFGQKSDWPEDRLTDPAYYRAVLRRRFFAHILDTVIVLLLMAPIIVAVLLTLVVTLGLIAIPLALAFVAVRIVYYAAFTGGPKSATPGMRVLGLELRDAAGGRPGYLQAALRTLLFYATLAALTPLILLVMLLTRDRRAVHDYLSATVVVNRLDAAVVKR